MVLSHNLHCHAKLSTIMSNPLEFISFMIFLYYFVDNFMTFITIDTMENTVLCPTTKDNAFSTDSEVFPFVRPNAGLANVCFSLFHFWQTSR